MKKYFLLFMVMVMILGLTYSAGERVVMTLAGESKFIPISRVKINEKISLTFNIYKIDDELFAILDTLDKNNVTATFYITKTLIEDNPETISKINEIGSEVGLLAFNQIKIKNLTRKMIKEELYSVSQKLEQTTGKKLKTIRPEGTVNQEIIYVAEEMGIFTVLWDLDSNDMKAIGVSDIVERVRSGATEGSIILFNTGIYTPDAINIIIRYLQEESYIICSVENMIYIENYTVNINGEQQRRN
ncbi:polysaccharide deacetylase family protein [Alkalicella caledoniensis]|uniref:Polysaccharide deacetylase family protein n=1 Tax=Alkalicella caledoniensis TaxID=2731377 RepID=A0A7G9W4N0_ALKCA|nr:polysaccharide deacetylase family protein [Alkalicella caledoniensis]QNO13642.1 polysaccharide deacetylase family protein [Alkalicella caledoniensis]